MSQNALTQAVTNIVQELKDFSSDDRARIVQASMTLLGETPTRLISNEGHVGSLHEKNGELPAKARNWMKHYGLTPDQVGQVFHFGDDGPQIIAAIPGTNRKDQVRNAYVLCGVARLLAFGETKFDDKAARAICEDGGFFDGTNHMKYMKGSEFTGSRDKGWVLTAPGLNLGASLVTQLSKD
jgi:hypothetical protein